MEELLQRPPQKDMEMNCTCKKAHAVSLDAEILMASGQSIGEGAGSESASPGV